MLMRRGPTYNIVECVFIHCCRPLMRSILLIFSLLLIVCNTVAYSDVGGSADEVMSLRIVEDNKTWMERNEGTFYGALFASLVAILSVLLTYLANIIANKKKERQISSEKRNMYVGIVCSTYNEFDYQQAMLDTIDQELSDIRKASIERANLALNSTPSQLMIDFLDKCRMQMLAYRYFDPRIVSMVSAYINTAVYTNRLLQFDMLKQLNYDQSGIDDRREIIRHYFNDINEKIKNMRKFTATIKSYLIYDIWLRNITYYPFLIDNKVASEKIEELTSSSRKEAISHINDFIHIRDMRAFEAIRERCEREGSTFNSLAQKAKMEMLDFYRSNQ